MTDNWNDLPLMLTIEEAGRLLQIGRAHAHGLATRYFDSGGTDGLPVPRLGGVLRAPRAALHELVTTGQLVHLASAHPRASLSDPLTELTPLPHTTWQGTSPNGTSGSAWTAGPAVRTGPGTWLRMMRTQRRSSASRAPIVVNGACDAQLLRITRTIGDRR